MKTCTYPGCGERHRAKGLCSLHYHRALRGKPLDGPPTTCNQPGCARPLVARLLCGMHYKRHRRGTHLDGPQAPTTPDPGLTRYLTGRHQRIERNTP